VSVFPLLNFIWVIDRQGSDVDYREQDSNERPVLVRHWPVRATNYGWWYRWWLQSNRCKSV